MKRATVVIALGVTWLLGPGDANADNRRLRALSQRHVSRYHADWLRAKGNAAPELSNFWENSSKLAPEIVDPQSVAPSAPPAPQ